MQDFPCVTSLTSPAFILVSLTGTNLAMETLVWILDIFPPTGKNQKEILSA